MGIKRFISKGITLKRILNLLRLEYYYTKMIVHPLYELLMSLQYTNKKQLMFFVDLLSDMLKVEPKSFLTYSEYMVINPTGIKLLDTTNLNLSYSYPRFDNLAIESDALINHQLNGQYTVCINDACIIGSSSIILLNQNKVLYDVKSLDKRNAVLYSADAGIIYSKGDDLIVSKQITILNFECGIWMGGNFSWNYYHLLYEFLIKFQFIENLNIPIEVPILMDRICLDITQFNDLVNLVNTQNRKIIFIENGVRYKIQELYYISCPNYIPPHFKNDRDILSTDMLFQKESILDFQKRLLEHAPAQVFPKRFYISRKNASGRRPFNEDAIFDVLKNFGFVNIAPEEFSITEQMTLFHGAEFIAGGSGAAFANLLFCSSSCRAIIFSKNRLAFSGFSTIASIVGVDLHYITEEATPGDKLIGIHDAFEIDILMLKMFLSKWLN